MTSRNTAAARIDVWARVRGRLGGEAAVAEVSALRAFAAGRADVFAWRPAAGVPAGRMEEAILPALGLGLAMRRAGGGGGRATLHHGAVVDARMTVRATGWSADRARIMRDLARLALDMAAERRGRAALRGEAAADAAVAAES